jgi:hypothetical protein
MSSCGAMPSSVELAWPTGLHTNGLSSTGTNLELPGRAKREGINGNAGGVSATKGSSFPPKTIERSAPRGTCNWRSLVNLLECESNLWSQGAASCPCLERNVLVLGA